MFNYVNPRLASRFNGIVEKDERIVFVTLRDPVVVMPSFIRNLFITILLGALGLAFYNVGFGFEFWFPSTGVATRIIFIIVVVLWVNWAINDYLAWQHELLAIAKPVKGPPRLYWRKGWLLKKASQVKINSLVSTPVNQAKHLYDSILNVGTIKLDVFASDDDIYFADTPRPFDLIHFINALMEEK